jgi:hypothetical protein
MFDPTGKKYNRSLQNSIFFALVRKKLVVVNILADAIPISESIIMWQVKSMTAFQ